MIDCYGRYLKGLESTVNDLVNARMNKLEQMRCHRPQRVLQARAAVIDGIPEAGLHHVAGLFRVASPKGPSSRRAIRRIRGAGGSAAEVAHSRMTCAACGMANGVAKHRPHCSQQKCHSDRQLWNFAGFSRSL